MTKFDDLTSLIERTDSTSESMRVVTEAPAPTPEAIPDATAD
jgi:hypothetical protein